jgi:tetratricopeptide (TPR) repeat protein
MPLAKNVALALISVVFFVLVAEGGLALLGVEPILYESDPLVGFASRIPLYEPVVPSEPGEGSGWVERATNKSAFFNYQRFPSEKPPDTHRVFCVGGSTTYGRPYDDVTSFCGWLRALLPVADPARPWEFINAGGISYASYRVAALMEELVQYQPDLFIIYTGHNEFLEARTYGELRESPALLLEARALLNQTRGYTALKNLIDGIRGTRSAEIMKENVLPGEVEALLDDSVGLQAYRRDDDMKAGVLAHFRINLNRMIDIADSVAAESILVTPASNLRHCSPFKSERDTKLSVEQRADWAEWMTKTRRRLRRRRFDQALVAVDNALAIDPRHAGSHYLRGEILYAASRFAEARASFQVAIDEDVCPLRAPTQSLEIVEEVASARGVPLVRWAEYLQGLSANGITGEEFFLDHVHTTIDANRILALQIIESLHGDGKIDLAASWDEAAIAKVAAQIESQLDPQAHARALTNLAKVFGWAGKTQEAHEMAVHALEAADDIEAFHNAAMNSLRLGRIEEAIEYYEQVLKRSPNHAAALSDMGFALTRLGRFESAARALRKSIESEDSERARFNMGALLERQESYDEAIVEFERAQRINPARGEYHIAAANVYVKLGELDRALRQYTQALEKNATLSLAYYRRAGISQRNNDGARAASDLRAMLALAPDSPRALAQLAWILAASPDAALRDGREAIAAAEHAVRLTRSRDADPLAALAAAYAEAGSWTEAVDTARRVIDTISADPEALELARASLAQYERREPYRLPR